MHARRSAKKNKSQNSDDQLPRAIILFIAEIHKNSRDSAGCRRTVCCIRVPLVHFWPIFTLPLHTAGPNPHFPLRKISCVRLQVWWKATKETLTEISHMKLWNVSGWKIGTRAARAWMRCHNYRRPTNGNNDKNTAKYLLICWCSLCYNNKFRSQATKQQCLHTMATKGNALRMEWYSETWRAVVVHWKNLMCVSFCFIFHFFLSGELVY